MAHPSKLTPQLIAKFLEILSNNGGIVTDAAADVNVSRCALYELRANDDDFAKRWDKAVDLGINSLEDEAKNRGLNGTEEDIYYQGDVVGHRRVKSDFCLAMVLRAHRRKYVDRREVTGADGKPLGTASVIAYIPDNGRNTQ
jgi:hypothetical protein